jgi:cation/acetate symporter
LPKIDMFCITAALMCGTAGLPHVIVRFFTVTSVKAVRQSACWTLLFIAVIYLTAPAVGAFARTNLMSEVHSTAYVDAPDWFKNWEDRGLIAWADKNDDGVMQHSAGPAFAGKPTYESKRSADGPRIVTNVLSENANEVYYDKDILVMANPEMAGLPMWVIALVMAGCVAAALSTGVGKSRFVHLPCRLVLLWNQPAGRVCRQNRRVCVWLGGVFILSDNPDGYLFQPS